MNEHGYEEKLDFAIFHAFKTLKESEF